MLFLSVLHKTIRTSCHTQLSLHQTQYNNRDSIKTGVDDDCMLALWPESEEKQFYRIMVREEETS